MLLNYFLKSDQFIHLFLNWFFEKMVDRNNLSVVLYGINDLRLEQTPLPNKPEPNEVQLATQTVGICGSDLHFWTKGRINNYIVKNKIICCHESSAVIVEIGENVKNLKVGDRVAVEPGVACFKCQFCKEGNYNLCHDMIFQSAPPFDGCLRRFYNHSSAFCHKIPDNMTFGEGAMIEPLAVAVHACKRSNIKHGLGQKVLVTGAGPVGLLSAMTAKAFGANDVCILDINESRLAFAQKIGIKNTLLVTKESTESIAQKVIEMLAEMPKITIECTGAEQCLNLAIDVTRDGGTVVLIGLNNNNVNVSLSTAGLRELNLIGNQRYCYDYPDAIDLVSSGKVDVKPLISHIFQLEDGIKAFETAKTCAEGVIKVHIECKTN